MPVADHPLWTDYVAAFGSIVGILIAVASAVFAGVALYYAIRGAADAQRSATSAERTADSASSIADASRATLDAAIEQLAVAREEHAQLERERARRPIVATIIPSEIEAPVGEEVPAGTFRIGFTNSGEAPLTEGLLTIMLDPGSSPELTDRWGSRHGGVPDDETIERWPGPDGLPRSFHYLVGTVTVRPGVSLVRYVRLSRYGRFPLRAKLFSAELEGGGPWIDVAVDVSRSGETRIEDLAKDAPSGPTEGRCADLETEES